MWLYLNVTAWWIDFDLTKPRKLSPISEQVQLYMCDLHCEMVSASLLRRHGTMSDKLYVILVIGMSCRSLIHQQPWTLLSMQSCFRYYKLHLMLEDLIVLILFIERNPKAYRAVNARKKVAL